MSKTLTQLISDLQALLLGDSDTFSTATCTAAIRSALKEINLEIPQNAAEVQATVADQFDYELEDQTALEVMDVLLEGTDTYEQYNVSIPFDGYFEDDRPYIRLREPLGSTEYIIIRFSKPYTINGLDSETVSTLPSLYDTVLLDGAAWMASLVRAAGRVETINMNPDISPVYEKLAAAFRQSFENGIERLKKRRPPVSEPETQGWNDEWNGQF